MFWCGIGWNAAAIASESALDEVMTARQPLWASTSESRCSLVSTEAKPKRLSGFPCHRLMKLRRSVSRR